MSSSRKSAEVQKANVWIPAREREREQEEHTHFKVITEAGAAHMLGAARNQDECRGISSRLI